MHGGKSKAPARGTWRAQAIFAALGMSLLTGLSALPAPTLAAEDLRTASLPPAGDAPREAELPTLLSNADLERYRQAFKSQAAGQWGAADREIARLNDKVLLGTLLAQRYLHRNYTAKYPELRDWLAEHNDEPQASEIYALAMKRRPSNGPMPQKPVSYPPLPRGLSDDSPEARAAQTGPGQPRSAAQQARATALKTEIRRLSESDPKKAEQLLNSGEAKKAFDAADFDDARTFLADAYLAQGEPQRALSLAATARTAAYKPLAQWEAGLAAWRLGKLQDARTHFSTLARAPNVSPWMTSAAAFWTARVELRAHRPEMVNTWLGIAAENPFTFYGLLARRSLGLDPYFNFDEEPFTDLDVQILGGSSAGRRALAYLQLGETAKAETELRALASRGGADVIQSVEALSDRANMPALSLQLAGALASADGRHHDHALYPVPRWTPRGGFTIDRALIFALMRQESQFLANAENPSGASGLMQLMPGTARLMAQFTGVKLKGADRVNDPEVNLTLAQEYLNQLVTHERVKGNLLLLVAGYNSGTGPLQRWLAQPEFKNDPLLFLESIPAAETRSFTQRVLTNYWIYRNRLGQASPDLDALAAGEWPTYTALDVASDETVSRHAENR